MNTSRRGFFGMVAGVLAACGVKAAVPVSPAPLIVATLNNLYVGPAAKAIVSSIDTEYARFAGNMASMEYQAAYFRFQEQALRDLAMLQGNRW